LTTTTNIDKTARTARQTAEVQRDSYEALAKSFSAMQRRNVEFAQMWMTGGFELMRAYQSFFSPFSYAQQGLKAAQQTTQHTQQALQAAQQELQVTQHELRVAEEATVKAENATAKAEKATVKAENATVKAEQATAKATVKAENAEQVTAKITSNTQAATREAALRLEEETREVALQAAVHRSLETKNYEELNVDEVSNKLDGLSATDLKKVREYEMHNKSRETLITEIDRRLSATA
jgi:hypothetical protein